jgi:AraC-like DNA-binding protein
MPKSRRSKRPRAEGSAGSPPVQVLVTSLMTTTFQDLDTGISIWTPGMWRAIHGVRGVVDVGVEQGAARARHVYNVRCLGEAQRTRRMVRGELFGFRDLFVPIVEGQRVSAILVAGPLMTARPTVGHVSESWYEMTQSQGRLSDPAFSRFLSETVSTLTLEGSLLGLLERMMTCFALLLAGQGATLAEEAEGIRLKLWQARFPERMWEAARAMVDDRTTHVWETPLRRDPLALVGMKRAPQHAMVGLLSAPSEGVDSVDAVLRRAAFQRASTLLASKQGNTVSGRVGDHGITLLVDHTGGAPRTRSALVDIVTRACALARRFGFELHVGIAQGPEGDSLAARYRAALGAAERAVSQGSSWVFSETHAKVPRVSDLRRELAESSIEGPGLLVPRFDRYIEAVLVHSGYQIEGIRAHLEAGIERLAEPLLETGTLDRRSFDELIDSMKSRDMDADTVTALVAAYRKVVSDIAAAIHGPTRARQDRSLGRALLFVREHLAEPLTLPRVSRVAGFAPGHFARLLKREQGASFVPYLQKLRLEHSKTMLIETALSVERIAHRSGFKSRTHFQRAFKDSTGLTPISYRQRPERALLLQRAPADAPAFKSANPPMMRATPSTFGNETLSSKKSAPNTKARTASRPRTNT